MRLPMRMDPSIMCFAFKGPRIRFSLIQCAAALAEQPHWEQSGSPPNTQGSTRVRRSAEMFFERREKVQCLGEAGGCRRA